MRERKKIKEKKVVPCCGGVVCGRVRFEVLWTVRTAAVAMAVSRPARVRCVLACVLVALAVCVGADGADGAGGVASGGGGGFGVVMGDRVASKDPRTRPVTQEGKAPPTRPNIVIFLVYVALPSGAGARGGWGCGCAMRT